ncbi:MAG: Transcriptional regulator, ArsR family protein [Myxococcaceae bacterium]|nr:Transcriptional regulator, ArsR family protein [Myxococcaceae bacterium]
MSDIDGILAALADPTRRRVVELLGKRPHRAGELATLLGLSAPAMSRHLKLLRGGGLVEEDHVGEDARVRTYRLRHEPVHKLRRWSEDVERFWTAQLGAFKKHAEQSRSKRRAGE